MSAAVAHIWRQFIGANNNFRAEPLAFLDIGTTKVCCYIARRHPSHGFVLLGRGYQGTQGVERGNVTDVDRLEDAIQAAVHQAEEQSHVTLREISVGISGCEPRTKLLELACELNGRPVTPQDVRHLLSAVKERAWMEDSELLHVVPIRYRIDNGREVRDPCGLSGNKLSVLASAMGVSSRPLQEILECVRRSHLEIDEVVSSSAAAGKACLADDEVMRGCIVLDLGGGTTGISYYTGGRLAFVGQVPVGGEDVTGDLAYDLYTNRQQAERLKGLYGSVQWHSGDDNFRIDVPMIGDHEDMPTGEVPRARITHTVRARMAQIFESVQARLRASRRIFEYRPPRSIVLTGGGSQLEGIESFAEEMFDMPVRRGRPDCVIGPSGIESMPCCAAASGGLALISTSDEGLRWRDDADGHGLSLGVVRLSRWFKENFER